MLRRKDIHMHIPSKPTDLLTITDFDSALREYEQNGISHYSKEKWLYIPDRYDEYRYLLGTKGKNPIVCVGINPSTAEPDKLDNTVKSVERHALSAGYDSFIMFNVYPQRATKPDDMDRVPNPILHRENMKAFEYVLKTFGARAIWAAWGAIIEKRAYLSELIADMAHIAEKYGAVWYTNGPNSKKGHPHHPLYLPNSSRFAPFDPQAYIADVLNQK